MNWAFLYVAALYFGSVWIWRRLASPIPWRVAVLFFALTLVFLFQPLVLKYTGVPADHLYTFFPWLGYEQVIELGNRHMNDVVLQMVPWAHQVRESWKQGEAPLWNAAAGGGYPLLANGQSGALSPLRLISIPLDLASSFTCEAALKILAALTFAWLYMRRRGRSEVAAILTAISYGFGAFLAIWLYFPHASVAAFVPAMFYAIDLLVERGSISRITFAAVVFATMLLNGHPETAGHASLIGGPYALFTVWTARDSLRSRARSAAVIVAAALLALLLALPFVLPFLEALPQSQRYDALRANPPVIPRFPLVALVTFMHPSFLEPGREARMPGSPEILCGYAGVLGAIGWFAVAFDVIRRRRWRSTEFFFVIAALFFVGVVLGWRGFADLVHALPMFELAANGRLRFVVAWCAAVLAGEAIDLLFRQNDRRPLLFGVGATALTLAIASVIWIQPHVTPGLLAFYTLPRLVVVLLALLVALRRRPELLGAALIAAVLLDLWSFGRRWYPPVPSKYLFADTPLLNEMRRRMSPEKPGELVPYRVAATGSTLFPNSAAVYGLQDIRAHDPMANSRFLGALRVYTGYTSHDYFAMLNKVDDPFLDFLNVRYIATSPLEDYRSHRFEQIYQGPDGRIFENRDVLPRFYAARNVFVEFDDERRRQRVIEHKDWANSVVLKYIPTQIVDVVRDDLLLPRPVDAPMGKVAIVSARPREVVLVVDAPRWTLVTGSHPHWPGWRVYRGPERLHIFEVNEAFLGFVVPAGRSTIRVVYVPRSFYVGMYASLLTAAALLAGIAWRSRNRLRETGAALRAFARSSPASFLGVIAAGAIFTTLVVMQVDGVNGPAHFRWPWYKRADPVTPVVTAMILAASSAVIAQVIPRTQRWLALALLVITPAALQSTGVSNYPSHDRGMVRATRLLRDPQIFSYFFAAEGLVQQRDWLRRFDSVLDTAPMHARTKPPGPIVAFVALINGFGARAPVIALGALLAGAAASVAAVYAAFRIIAGSEAALQGATVFSLVPSMVVFYPVLDSLYPVFTAGVMAFWFLAIHRGGVAEAIAFGLVVFAMSLASYALLVLGAWCVLTGVHAMIKRRWLPVVRASAVSLVTIILAYCILWLVAGFNPISTFSTALARQRDLLEWLNRTIPSMARHLPHTIWGDLIDFAFGLSWIPIALAVAWVTLRTRGERPAVRIAALAGLATPIIVAVTGLLQAETARVWIFLMPLVALPAGLELARWPVAHRIVAHIALLICTVAVFCNNAFLIIAPA